MGIRNLNRYLRDNCPESVRPINIADLSGKQIAVDISIYLYKYESEGVLLENMYLMLSIFRHYNIIPIFIFDGKPPVEKKALLAKRREDRAEAQQEYNKLQLILDSKKNDVNNVNDKETQDNISEMEQLKKQTVQISKDKIEKVKLLIKAYGATYYDAPGEADVLCALLVIKKKVWLCLSEDMDLFVYGCTRVLRYFSLMNHNAVLYYMKGILKELNMTQKEFTEICVLSGTDYNINATNENKIKNNGQNDNNINLHITLKHYRKFKSTNTNINTNINTNKYDFYKWLLENTNYISDIELLTKINQMFLGV